ncbi:FadR family transcriptional regulator [Treponema phagedenis]|uniref:FadR family transcriptional regulator n=1 Tax=Treponema phagedenis TaxID=162 RepID=A0A0B7GQW4_TREPH|nr:GntR family transcriptional regulator [Treponema phagedenis]NVP24535.1 FadR family transcriptional regulator [Treponema phagedenis]QEJ94770.1 FadR family transcriptional regulator [Treponema phagedenis]QEJ97707.1 FadR family transcriptional regulator [Treponema phagedenis]QEK00676.1 FadR family transcriptional regulator [Treponema phagedenis]QEK03274.1 FadR family transcriptional regulator [Treponema phagedenis]
MQKKQEEFKKDTLASMIQDMILSGAILPGERLAPERELAETFGVSRPAIHEALLQLQAKGFIVIRPRHGCVVNDFSTPASISLMTELYLNNRMESPEKIEAGLVEFRQIILTEVIKKIIAKTAKLSVKARDKFFLPLENLIEFSETENSEKISHEDFEFYKVLIGLSAQPIFLLVIEAAREIYIYQFRQFLYKNAESIYRIPEYKANFIEALKSRNEEKAVEIMRKLTEPKTYRSKKTSAKKRRN